MNPTLPSGEEVRVSDTKPMWEYRVALIDYRGRISVEGQQRQIGSEHRTTFVRQFLDEYGLLGWELAGIQPLSPHSAYYVFKRGRASEYSSM